MSHGWLLFAHQLGVTLLGAAIVALWRLGERIRRAEDCGTLARAGRSAEALGKRLRMPGVLLFGVSGVWLLARDYGGWESVRIPWLAGKAAIFVFQFAWANLVTRPHAQRLGRLIAGRRDADPLPPELEQARRAPLPRFGQPLDPLLFALAVALGVLRPMGWTVVALGCGAAALAAATIALYPARPLALSSLNKPSVEAEGGR